MIFNLAVNMELVKQENYPFRKFKISKLHQETAKRALTKEEIQTTINYPTAGKDFYTRLAINLFTFSYFMGGIKLCGHGLSDRKEYHGEQAYIPQKKNRQTYQFAYAGKSSVGLEGV